MSRKLIVDEQALIKVVVYMEAKPYSEVADILAELKSNIFEFKQVVPDVPVSQEVQAEQPKIIDEIVTNKNISNRAIRRRKNRK